MIQRQIDIRQGLCLDTLCRIHDKDCAVAGCQGTADLVIEVYMSRCVDEVENIFLSILCPIHGTHSLCLDGDAPFSLQVHVVQHLCLHLSAGEQTGLLDDAVCQGGFTVIYMCHNTKIADLALVYCCHTTVLS